MKRHKNKNYLKETLEQLSSFPPIGTHGYANKINELISNLQSIKRTLKRGPERKNFRKEKILVLYF